MVRVRVVLVRARAVAVMVLEAAVMEREVVMVREMRVTKIITMMMTK